MKFNKIYTVMACAAVLCGAASCDQVTEPVLQKPDPATFQIYAPAMQDQYIQLTEDGTFELVLNGQPSYGFSAVTQYRAQVSLDGNFDENSPELTPTGTGTLSRMTLSQLDLAEAITKLHGWEEKEDYVDQGEEKVYFRGVAYIEGIEESWVATSNSTSLNRVQSFFSVPKPGQIWVIGNYAGDWISPEAAQEAALEPYALSEKDDEVRSKIYYGNITFTVEDAGCIFRFYTALDGWDNSSVGCSGGSDSDTPVEFPDFVAGNTLTHGLAKTKDSFSFPNYCGPLQFKVDLNTNEATFTAE